MLRFNSTGWNPWPVVMVTNVTDGVTFWEHTEMNRDPAAATVSSPSSICACPVQLYTWVTWSGHEDTVQLLLTVDTCQSVKVWWNPVVVIVCIMYNHLEWQREQNSLIDDHHPYHNTLNNTSGCLSCCEAAPQGWLIYQQTNYLHDFWSISVKKLPNIQPLNESKMLVVK